MAKIFSICLHRVSDEYSPAYPPIPVDVFKKLIIYLKKRYGFLSLEDLNDSEKRKKGGILLTFDDAYYDFYTNAYPFLKAHNIPTILNVITSCAETGASFWTQKLNKIVEAFYRYGRSADLQRLTFLNDSININQNIERTSLILFKILLEKPNKDSFIQEMTDLLGYTPEYTKMMNWEEINEVSKNGIIIGSHTHTHRNLTLLKKEELLEELSTSSNLFKLNLGFSPVIIAYPNGIYNQDVLDVSCQLNYKVAFTINISAYKEIYDTSHFNLIPRINVYNQSFIKNWLKLTYYFTFK